MGMSPSSVQVAKHRWYALAILGLMYACHYIDRSVLSIVLEPIKREFHLSDSQLGALTGLAYGLSFAIACIPIGLLVDRVNRKRLLAALLFLWSSATALCGFAQSFIGLLMGRCAVGMAESGGSPCAISLIADYFPTRERSKALGLFFIASSVGTIVSFSIGGYVVAEFGWRRAFLIAGAPGLLMTGVILATLREPSRRASDITLPSPASASVDGGRIRRPISSSLSHLVVGMIINTAVTSGIWSWAASFFIREWGLGVKAAGVVVALGIGIGGGVGTASSGAIADFVGKRGLEKLPIMSAVICVGVTAFAIAFLTVRVQGAAISLFLLWCVLSASFMAPAYSLVLALTHTDSRGFTLSVIQTLLNLVGYGVGAFLVGFLSDMFGGPQSLSHALLVIGLFSLWGSWHYWRASKTVGQDLSLSNS